MKAMILCLSPKEYMNLLNGDLSVLVRLKFPKNYSGLVYGYCTKDKKYANLINRGGFLTGMVVARFWCDKVEGINRYCTGRGISYKTETLNDIELCDKSCLDFIEIDHYLYFKKGYAIHITKLEIFDKPKEIKDFSVYSHTVSGIGFKGEEKQFKILKPLNRAPQSWCFVEI